VNPKRDEVVHFQTDDREVMDTRKEKFIAEEVITDATGKKRWLQTIKRPLADHHGLHNQILGVATDITERKNMELALMESQERYRALFQYNPLMIFTVDDQGITRTVNDEGARQLGYAVEDLVGRPVIEVFHKDDRKTVE